MRKLSAYKQNLPLPVARSKFFQICIIYNRDILISLITTDFENYAQTPVAHKKPEQYQRNFFSTTQKYNLRSWLKKVTCPGAPT